MHDGMKYEPFNVGNSAILKSYLLHHLQRELATDNYGTISKFEWARFLIFGLVFVSVTLNLTQTSVAKSRPSVPYGANLFSY